MLCCRDNNESQTKKADATIQKMLADKLCKVPRSQVRTLRIINKSSLVNTETWVSSWLVDPPTYLHAHNPCIHPCMKMASCSELGRQFPRAGPAQAMKNEDGCAGANMRVHVIACVHNLAMILQ